MWRSPEIPQSRSTAFPPLPFGTAWNQHVPPHLLASSTPETPGRPGPHIFRDSIIGPVGLPPLPPDSWTPAIVQSSPLADLSAGEYGLLNHESFHEDRLPRDGLMSLSPLNSHILPIAAGRGEPVPTSPFGADGPEADPPEVTFGQHLHNVFRALLGLGPARDDLAEDERGNIHAPEVSDLIQDVVAATKADELELRRRIDEVFQGEARSAYWFHQYLSDILAGDPPEEILQELSYRGDERFRDQRLSIAHWAGLVGIPAAAGQPPSRPFTHLNDPVPRHPDMEKFRTLMHNYKLNQEARALERVRTSPTNWKSVMGNHSRLQGEEFEGVARGYDTALGNIVGPRLTVVGPRGERIYDYVLLDRLNRLLNPVEAKSGGGRVRGRQRVFDRSMDPPVVYRKEKDVLFRGQKMLSHYDRLWMLRNAPPQSRSTDPSTW